MKIFEERNHIIFILRKTQIDYGAVCKIQVNFKDILESFFLKKKQYSGGNI